MYALHSHIFFTTVYSAGRTYRHSVLPSPLSLPFRYTSSFPFGHTHAYTLDQLGHVGRQCRPTAVSVGASVPALIGYAL